MSHLGHSCTRPQHWNLVIAHSCEELTVRVAILIRSTTDDPAAAARREPGAVGALQAKIIQHDGDVIGQIVHTVRTVRGGGGA